nr:MAG TPA: hypothetical protein [Microviridae sp.]
MSGGCSLLFVDRCTGIFTRITDRYKSGVAVFIVPSD